MNSKPEKKPPRRITQDYLHNAGLHYLQRFAASSHQFREVMLRKVKKSCRHHAGQDYETCAAMVEALVQKFQASGLLNDDVYTRGIVGSLRRQGKSRRAILSKLGIKGIPLALAQQKLEEEDQDSLHPGADSELHAAIIFARRKKFGPFSSSPGGEITDKTLSSFGRAGFSYDTSRRVLGMSRDDAEDLLRA